MLLPVTPEYWADRCAEPNLCRAGDCTQGFVHARQVLCQLNHITHHPSFQMGNVCQFGGRRRGKSRLQPDLDSLSLSSDK